VARGSHAIHRRMAEAPFRILALHQPGWGFVEGGADRWTDWANARRSTWPSPGTRIVLRTSSPASEKNNYPSWSWDRINWQR